MAKQHIFFDSFALQREATLLHPYRSSLNYYTQRVFNFWSNVMGFSKPGTCFYKPWPKVTSYTVVNTTCSLSLVIKYLIAAFLIWCWGKWFWYDRCTNTNLKQKILNLVLTVEKLLTFHPQNANLYIKTTSRT